MRGALSGGKGKWDRFWFESGRPETLNLFRSSLGWLLFAFYAIRSIDLRYFYSENGFLSLAAIEDSMPMQYRYSIFQVFTSDAALLVGNALFMLSLLGLALNRFPRVSSWVALILHLSFLHRNMATAYGIDLITTYFLFYLSLAVTREMSSVALRLVQIQVCVIYAYSGWEKLKGVSWWSGEALWMVFANAQIARFDFSFLSHVPGLLAVASLLTLAWEIYFPVLVWLQRWRKPALIFGTLFHAGIALTIHITFFAGIMVISYLAFLNDEEARRMKQWLKNHTFRFFSHTRA